MKTILTRNSTTLEQRKLGYIAGGAAKEIRIIISDKLVEYSTRDIRGDTVANAVTLEYKNQLHNTYHWSMLV